LSLAFACAPDQFNRFPFERFCVLSPWFACHFELLSC